MRIKGTNNGTHTSNGELIMRIDGTDEEEGLHCETEVVIPKDMERAASLVPIGSYLFIDAEFIEGRDGDITRAIKIYER
jgi:hypothetical protein